MLKGEGQHVDEKRYAFSQNCACEFFPCHSGVDAGEFNCLFCFCPLYALGRGCGGDFRYLENGIKDCSACTFPHRRENYQAMIDKIGSIVELVRERSE